MVIIKFLLIFHGFLLDCVVYLLCTHYGASNFFSWVVSFMLSSSDNYTKGMVWHYIQQNLAGLGDLNPTSLQASAEEYTQLISKVALIETIKIMPLIWEPQKDVWWIVKELKSLIEQKSLSCTE